jgi:hypothetical protein
VLERTTQLEAAMVDQRQAWSALQETQKMLAHVTRLTTISELTATLAHQVNQPLTAIVANVTAGLRWLDRSPQAIDQATEAMQRVIRDAERAAGVIAHARALVKKSDGEKCLVEVDQIIREVLSFVQPELAKHQVVVEEALAEGLLPVLADRIQLQQLVLNLIMNGIDAMAEVTAPAPAGRLVRAWARRGRRRRPRFSAGRGYRGGESGPRETVRSLLHDQARWPGNGVVDWPVHRSGSRRTAVGSPQPGSWAELSSAGPGGQPSAGLSPIGRPSTKRVSRLRQRGARTRPGGADVTNNSFGQVRGNPRGASLNKPGHRFSSMNHAPFVRRGDRIPR